MCKELPVILVNRMVDPKRIIGKNGGLRRRRRGTRGRWPPKSLPLLSKPAAEFRLNLHLGSKMTNVGTVRFSEDVTAALPTNSGCVGIHHFSRMVYLGLGGPCPTSLSHNDAGAVSRNRW
jgi:hypothetical protein